MPFDIFDIPKAESVDFSDPFIELQLYEAGSVTPNPEETLVHQIDSENSFHCYSSWWAYIDEHIKCADGETITTVHTLRRACKDPRNKLSLPIHKNESLPVSPGTYHRSYRQAAKAGGISAREFMYQDLPGDDFFRSKIYNANSY